MALIKCLECGEDVSTNATACPHCGNPMNSKIITIESTSKRWKAVILAAILLMIISAAIAMYYRQEGTQSDMLFWLNVFLCSLVLFFIGKIGAWWSNK